MQTTNPQPPSPAGPRAAPSRKIGRDFIDRASCAQLRELERMGAELAQRDPKRGAAFETSARRARAERGCFRLTGSTAGDLARMRGIAQRWADAGQDRGRAVLDAVRNLTATHCGAGGRAR